MKCNRSVTSSIPALSILAVPAKAYTLKQMEIYNPHKQLSIHLLDFLLQKNLDPLRQKLPRPHPIS